MWPDTCPLTPAVWLEAREMGYHYCALIEQQRIQSIAAVWRYSETAWEVAAVRTRPKARRRGCAKTVVSYVTAHILDAGRRATCTTAWDNVAMQRTAESVGFGGIDQDQGRNRVFDKSPNSRILGPGWPQKNDTNLWLHRPCDLTEPVKPQGL